MSIADQPDPSQLPTTRKLLQSTAIAAVVAAALLATVVLPAEYGIDPTGVGRLLGLTQMGEVKAALAKEAADAETSTAAAAPPPTTIAAAPAPAATPATPAVPAPASRRDEMTVTLANGEGTEVKLDMKAGAKARYEWATNGPQVNFDTHGEAPDASGYRSYGKGADSRGAGEITAGIDGVHGWFWRNRSGQPVTITVKAEGDFSAMKHID